mgnify:CR=1 FL=1
MSTPSLFTVELPLPDDTDRLGAALADVLIALRPQIDAAESGLAMRLEGDLGAGKTSLVRAMLRRLGWTGAVKSPTLRCWKLMKQAGSKSITLIITALKHPKNSKVRGLPIFMQREPSAPPNGAAKPLRLYLRPT